MSTKIDEKKAKKFSKTKVKYVTFFLHKIKHNPNKNILKNWTFQLNQDERGKLIPSFVLI